MCGACAVVGCLVRWTVLGVGHFWIIFDFFVRFFVRFFVIFCHFFFLEKIS